MAENSPRGYFKTKKRYVQVGHLGRGGMAVVSESKDEYFQRNIAYKKLKPGPNLEKRTEEFVREALIMGKLEHPGILPVHDLIEEPEDTAAITMDKVTGISLAEKIAQTRKDPTTWALMDRLRTFQKLVEIVAYSHSRQIVHRDIKPANVMLGEKGDVILLDWGLAKVSQVKEGKFAKGWDAKILDSAQSVSGSIKGTPYYMSSESAQGKSDIVKEYSDVFSLGAVLYEFITLNYLIEGTKAVEVLKNAAECKYKMFHREALESDKKCKEKKLPVELAYILAKSLKQEYKERYKDAVEMNTDLLCVINDQPILACGGTFSLYQITKKLSKHAMALVLIGLPLLGIASMGNRMSDERLKTEAELQMKLDELQSIKTKLDANKKKLEQSKNNNLTLDKNNIAMNNSIREAESKKLDLIEKNSNLKVVVDKLIDKEQDNEIQGVNNIEFESEIAVIELEKNNMEKSQNQERHLGLYQEFLRNTVPFGLDINRIRLQFESGRRLEALKSLKSDSLKIDPFVVDWMEKYYGSSVRQGSSVERLLDKGKENHRSELLSWMKKEEHLDELLKKMSKMFPHKKWTQILKDKGVFIAFAIDGTCMDLSGAKPIPLYSHIAVPTEVKLNSEGEFFGHYGDGWYFQMKNISSPPQLIYVEGQTKKFEMANDWLFIHTEKNVPLAFSVNGPLLEWKVVTNVKDNVLEKDIMFNGPSLILNNLNTSALENFPPGYRLFNNVLNDGPWLIAYINILSSRFRNHLPDRGSKDVVWSLSSFDPLTSHDDGAVGWLMLGKDGRLFSFRPDQAPRQMFPQDKKLSRLFAIKSCNLAFAQDENMTVYVYYLNTGQYLFSPGTVSANIEEVMLDAQNRLLFHLSDGTWVSQGHG